MPFILQQVDLVVVCCQQEAAELKQFRVARLVESKNWIDPELADALDSTPKGLVEGFDYIVSYVGPLEGERNVHLLVKVADRLQGRAGVVVAGGGEAAARLRREAAARRNLVLVERHDVRQIASIIKSSIAGVDFSPCEPMGIRALEYLYAGVPFAVPSGSRAVWYITDGVEGIHLDTAEGVDEFVKWVDALIEKPEMREEMGRRARRKAEGLTAVKLAELIAERARQT
jgi:Glycosyltransferase